MSKAMPTVGDMVVYHPTQTERGNMINVPACNDSDALPAVVVETWSPDCVNLKVFVDGTLPDLWVTSAQKGKGEGQWEWNWDFNR